MNVYAHLKQNHTSKGHCDKFIINAARAATFSNISLVEGHHMTAR